MNAFTIKINLINKEEEISLLTGEHHYGYDKKMFLLNINGKKSAYLLNSVLSWKIHSRPISKTRQYWVNDVDRFVGGGVFVKCNALIAITGSLEVGLIFNRYNKINEFIRVVNGRNNLEKTIKNKLALELKKFWEIRSNKNAPVKIEGEYGEQETYNEEITFEEYRTLYEYLMGRDENKIKEKYGANIFQTMIGVKINDQFVISAIDVINTEICKIIGEQKETLERMENDYRDSVNKLRIDWELEKKDIKETVKMKIKKLEEQITLLKYNNNYIG